jgi:hypothetical protein
MTEKSGSVNYRTVTKTVYEVAGGALGGAGGLPGEGRALMTITNARPLWFSIIFTALVPANVWLVA